MNILLLNPRLKSWSPNVYVPIGLAYVAAALEQAGHKVEIIDLNVQKIKAGDLWEKAKNGDIIGISGMITEYEIILQLIDTVKMTNGKAKVILGGPLVTALPQELMQKTQADFAVIGEGEKTVVQLVSALERGDDTKDIKGIAYKTDGSVTVTAPAEPIADLDAVPFPAWHLLNMKSYIRDHFESFGIKIKGFGKIRSTNLISSRGCPYQCTFCFKDMWGNKWRARSAENIVNEMESLQKTYGINGFFFTDDTFVLDNDRVIEFCNLLKERKLNAVWYCNGRVNLMTRVLLAAMYSAGCRGIAYGIESGNQQILDAMKKRITLEQIREVVGWTKKAGIHVTGYFMLGNLGETRATIRETIDFARELDLDYHGFSLTTPIPGTELFDTALKAGLITGDQRAMKEWGSYANANLTRDCSDKDLTDFSNETFQEFYLKKRFGRYFFLNPKLLIQEIKVLTSLRNTVQAKELAHKVGAVISSYVRKRPK